METSLKTGFAQIFSCCPKNLSCPNFGGAAAPLAPRPVRLCKQLSRCCINFPHELTYQIDGHSLARSMYSHVITKVSRMGRLPRFLNYGTPPKRGASRRAWSSANSEGGLLCWLPWSSFTDKRSEVLFFVYIFFLHESDKRCLGYLSKKSELNSLKLSRDNRKIVVFKISWFGTILSKKKTGRKLKVSRLTGCSEIAFR